MSQDSTPVDDSEEVSETVENEDQTPADDPGTPGVAKSDKRARRIEDMADAFQIALERTGIATPPSEESDEEYVEVGGDELLAHFDPESLDPKTIIINQRFHWMALDEVVSKVLISVSLFITFSIAWMLVFSKWVDRFLPTLPINDWVMIGIAALAALSVIIWYSLNNLPTILKWQRERYILTKTHFILKLKSDSAIIMMIGKFKNYTATMPLEDITLTEVERDWLGRIFNYGTIKIGSLTQEDERFHEINFVKRPYWVIKQITDHSGG